MTRKYTEELERGYTALTVMEEAQRCLLCHDAPCTQACPAGTDPGRFIRSVRFRNFKGAAETIRENNALGAICARVCPTERYCQKGCSRCGIDKPIDIGGIQRFVTDFEAQTGVEILKAGPENGLTVAIVGSGPSALQAAATLRALGYGVEIFEAQEKAGGYLRYGIPEYRLPEAVLEHELSLIEKLGVKFQFKTKVGQDISLAELKERYPQMPVYPAARQGWQKLSAAWLVAQAGFPKGYASGRAALSSAHTLVLINPGQAQAQDILDLAQEIRAKVQDTFQVELVPEPNLLGFE